MPSPRGRLLLVDGDESLAVALSARLSRRGHAVAVSADPASALRSIERMRPDLVILDLDLPGIGGRGLARRIRRRADIPILVLTASDSTHDKVEMLDRYAEDYVTKPFDPAELEARIRSILRRSRSIDASAEIVLFPGLTIDLKHRRATIDDRVEALSPIEARFLNVLVEHAGSSVRTEDLLATVWRGIDGAEPAYVWVLVRRLRRKLEVDPDHPVHLVTAEGSGYRLAGVHPAH